MAEAPQVLYQHFRSIKKTYPLFNQFMINRFTHLNHPTCSHSSLFPIKLTLEKVLDYYAKHCGNAHIHQNPLQVYYYL